MTLVEREEQRPIVHLHPVALVGTSAEAQRMRAFAEKAARTEHTILLRGETGVGKDHLAELVHSLGRREYAFVPVDCGALTESLSESELFGHTQGAFTDARSVKIGLIQAADCGTIFFNEVANMSLSLQAKFLRILEKRSFRPVGGVSEYPVTARIIAATNADLEAAVKRGALRSDLYHRLNGITYVVPPLRDRSADIMALADHFFKEEQWVLRFTLEAAAVMTNYHWPGNVRELRNAIIRAAFEVDGRGEIDVAHVHPYLAGVGDRELQTLDELERNYLRDVLRKCCGNIPAAAAIAGIGKSTMYRYVEKFQLRDYVDGVKGE